jgi:hypothetical protein
MQWQIFIALVIAIPVILFPVAVIWFLNIGGIFTGIKEAWMKRGMRNKKRGAAAD